MNLKFSKMWAFGDLSAFPTDIGTTQNWTFCVWNEEGLGFLSFKPFNYYLTMLLASFFLGSSSAQKFIFLSAPVVSFLTFYFFVKKLNVNTMASILGALTYSLNPITISELIGGSMTLTVYSVFPIILFYIIKIIQCQKFDLKDMVILGSLGFFMFNIHAAFWYITSLIPLLLLSMLLLNRNLRIIVRLMIPLIITTLILLPNILGYAGIYGTATSSRNISFKSSAAYCYKDSTFYNTARLAGNKGSAQAKEFLNYNGLNSYTILGYILPIIAFFSFLVKNQCEKKIKKVLAISMAFAFLVSCGLIFLVHALPFIVDLHPILASLRNPVKLMYPLSLSLCFLFAIGTEQLFIRLKKKPNLGWNIIIVFTLAVIILLYNYPALDGTLGLAKVRDDDYYIKGKYYTLPNTLEKIDKNYGDYRVLFLPWEYPTLLKVRSQIPNYFGISVGAGISCSIDWLKNTFELIATKNSSDRSYLLGLFGVKYVVIDKSFKSYYEGQEWYENLKKGRSHVIYESHNSYWATGEPSYYYKVFNYDQNFELIYEDSDFAIFKNKRAVTKLYTRSNAVNFTLSYTPISENLLKNPSFENDTEYWNIWPSNLVNVTDNYNRGDKTIALYGQEKWFTICYQVVHVEENSFYYLEFSVKGSNITDMHAKVLWYNITENLTEGNAFSVNYIKLYQMDLKDGEWSKVEEPFSVPKGAKMARIQFLANRLEGIKNTLMCIDDVSFSEIEMIIKNKNEIFSSIRNINYTKINPTKYVTRINAPSPFIIALSETHNPSWVCYVNDERISSILLYGVINGFWINQTGQLEIVIEYKPQKLFYIGCAISITTLIACIAYLTYAYTKNKNILQKLKHLLAGNQK